MKKFFCLAFLFVLCCGWSQKIKKPPEGKAVVYFVRTSAAGFLINFKYFDGDKYLGKYADGYFMPYVCEPGKHLFWAKSENFDFVEADLEAGKIYVIDAVGKMGAFKAAVELTPYDDNVNNYKNEKKYRNKREDILSAILESELYVPSSEMPDEDMADLYKRALEKYNVKKADGKVAVLRSDMNYRL